MVTQLVYHKSIFWYLLIDQKSATMVPEARSMRRKQRKSSDEAAWELLRAGAYYQVATTRPDGQPVLRTLNGVLLDDRLLFHGAVAGEKMECLGRDAVVEVYEVIADIPSYFVDPMKGCPATTYFRSVQGKGRLVEISDVESKVRMLDEFMQKYQPEGGHMPFSDAIYAKDLRSVRVFGLELDDIVGKTSMGQDRPVERTRKVVQGLFRRGAPRDCWAIEEILRLSPDARPSDWRREVEGSRVEFKVFPLPEEVAAHARLLEEAYWRSGSDQASVRLSIERSDAWVGAVDSDGQLLGAARAVTDSAWTAQISDVVVALDWRGKGVGRHLMQLLLDHPQVRGCRFQKLGTRDAQEFYETLGFRAGPVDIGFSHEPMVRMPELGSSEVQVHADVLPNRSHTTRFPR